MSHQQSFSYVGKGLPGLDKLGLMCQGHKTVTPVRLEPAASRSRVKHSTTEPQRSLVPGWILPNFKRIQDFMGFLIICKNKEQIKDEGARCSQSPTPRMLQMKFDIEWPACLRDNHV